MDQFFSTLGNLFLLVCVLPTLTLLVLAALLFWFGRRWFNEFVTPDAEKMHSKLQTLQAKHPHLDQAQLVRRVVNQEAMRCGLVGLVTGVGGFFTLPITLPIDMLLSVRIQAAMVSFIAQVYGYENATDNRVATYVILSQSGELAQMSIKTLMKYLPRFFTKSFSKLIPFLGAIISFAVNYVIAQSTARVALRWYGSKSRQEVLQLADARPLS